MIEFKYKKGDEVEVQGYVGKVILEQKDDTMTLATGKPHWFGVSKKYLESKIKTNNVEPFSEDEIKKQAHE